MPSHNKLTKLNRPVVRETTWVDPETHQPLLIRVEEKGVEIRLKRSRHRCFLTYPQLHAISKKRAKEVKRVQKWKEGLASARGWGTWFIKCLDQGMNYEEIASLLAQDNLLRDDNLPWRPRHVAACARRERARRAKESQAPHESNGAIQA